MNYEKMWKNLRKILEDKINIYNLKNKKNKTDKLIVPLCNGILDIMNIIESEEIKNNN